MGHLLSQTLSTDDEPQHGLCPDGNDSSCGFKKAKALNQPYVHRHALPEAVLIAIKPIYRDLSKPDLFEKFLHEQTQNPNESFNSVIWKHYQKPSL